MKIQESALDNFYLIQTLAKTHNICLGNYINIQADISHIIANFHALASLRPRLKKLGIYSQITLNHLSTSITPDICQQILRRYIYSLDWNDLQYISFFGHNLNQLEFYIVLNRVTPENNLIDLNCIGANSLQYQLLRQSYYQVINPSLKLECGINGCRG